MIKFDDLFEYDVNSLTGVYVEGYTNGLLDCLRPTPLLIQLTGFEVIDEFYEISLDNVLSFGKKKICELIEEID